MPENCGEIYPVSPGIFGIVKSIERYWRLQRNSEVGKFGRWETRKLGNSEDGKFGRWEIRKMGKSEDGKFGTEEIRKRGTEEHWRTERESERSEGRLQRGCDFSDGAILPGPLIGIADHVNNHSNYVIVFII